MDVLLTIGQFSRMTYLTVKALRHYHDVGLLEPAVVDSVSGYRRYAPSQVATAQAIRRFRELGLPLDEVRQVLEAPDVATRNGVILAHLERMHQQLEQTEAAVASLQALLSEEPHRPAPVEIRRLPPARGLAARAEVAFVDCGPWLERALADLHATVDARRLVVSGPDGALYSDEFFEEGTGPVTAFVPVAAETGAASTVELAPMTAAVLVHEGPFAELDQAYASLGMVVAERGIAGPGPIREHYLTATSTEVCWPVVP